MVAGLGQCVVGWGRGCFRGCMSSGCGVGGLRWWGWGCWWVSAEGGFGVCLVWWGSGCHCCGPASVVAGCSWFGAGLWLVVGLCCEGCWCLSWWLGGPWLGRGLACSGTRSDIRGGSGAGGERECRKRPRRRVVASGVVQPHVYRLLRGSQGVVAEGGGALNQG